jgi:RecA-family ATPase/5S rRNA maturation endonuclease (ribonuclease M5)
MSNIDFASLAEPVAMQLFRDKHNTKMSSANELRFGTKGSLSICLKKGTYFDNEDKSGGGLKALIERETGQDGIEWLIENKHINDTRGQGKVSDFSDVSDKPKGSEYLYTNEDGEPLYKVIRKYTQQGERRFYQNGFVNGQFVKSMDGVKPVPYKLTELTTRRNEPVYIVEGEKDAERLLSGGLLATTNSGGANNWKPDLNRHFENRDVIIIPDNDETGRKHVIKICENLAEIAKTIKVVHLNKQWRKIPEKGDVSDFLNAGYVIQDLARISRETPLYGFPDAREWLSDALITDDMLNTTPPAREHLIYGLLPAGVVGIIGAPGGTGKSMCALQMSISMACGAEFFGHEIERPCKVLYLSAEDDKEECWRRLNSFVTSNSIDGWQGKEEPIDTELLKRNLFIKSLVGESFLLTQAEGTGVAMPTSEADNLADLVAQIDNIKLIVVDTYSRFNGGKENSNEDAAQFIKACERLSKKTGATVLIIAHTRKGGRGDVDDLAGGARFVDSSRWAATLHEYLSDEQTLKQCEKQGIEFSEAKRHVCFKVVKDNYLGIKGNTIYLRRSEHGGILKEHKNMLTVIGENAKQTKAVNQYGELCEKLVTLLRERNANKDYITTSKLKNAYSGKEGRFGVSDKVLLQVLERAIDEGVIFKRPIKPKGESLHVTADEAR